MSPRSTGLVPEAFVYDSTGRIVGDAEPAEEEHNTVIVANSNGTFGWQCSCGDEADEFEDEDAADTDADEHRFSHS